MRKFDYRVPRYSVHLPIRLTLEDSIQTGLCTEISTDGMKLELSERVSKRSSGSVHVDYQNLTLDLPIRVAYSGSVYGGVRFVYATDEQRDEVKRLVAHLAAIPRRLGPILMR